MIAKHAEHSFDLDRITPGETCIDAGCRGFVIPQLLADRGARVVALDPDPAIHVPLDLATRITFLRAALVGTGGAGETDLHLHPTDTQAHTTVAAFTGGRTVRVPYLSWDSLLNRHCPPAIQPALLKLDCEGAEYGIVAEIARRAALGYPAREFPRQISVEYHDHCGLNPEPNMTSWYGRTLEKLRFRYEITKHERETPPWGGAPHYIDDLYTLRAEFYR